MSGSTPRARADVAASSFVLELRDVDSAQFSAPAVCEQTETRSAIENRARPPLARRDRSGRHRRRSSAIAARPFVGRESVGDAPRLSASCTVTKNRERASSGRRLARSPRPASTGS